MPLKPGRRPSCSHLDRSRGWAGRHCTRGGLTPTWGLAFSFPSACPVSSALRGRERAKEGMLFATLGRACDVHLLNLPGADQRHRQPSEQGSWEPQTPGPPRRPEYLLDAGSPALHCNLSWYLRDLTCDPVCTSRSSFRPQDPERPNVFILFLPLSFKR